MSALRPSTRSIRSTEKEQHLDRVKVALEEVYRRKDLARRSAIDPIEFVRRFQDPLDRELVAVLASSMAFGKVIAFRPKIEKVLEVLGESPSIAARDGKKVGRALAGFKHRLYTGGDVTALLLGTSRLQEKEGSLGAFVEQSFARHGDLLSTASELVQTIRSLGGLDQRTGSGARHLFVDPRDGSAAKRVMLLFRWMARGEDGVDLGVWKIPASALVMPVDVHIHRLSLNLGFTRRSDASWKTAEEITSVLRRFDAGDPVRYDFSLCHLGMVQRCPSKMDSIRCEGCGVQPVCLHWEKARKKEARAKA